MSWGMVAGAAIGVVGNAATKKSNGGAGTQTQTNTKEPWEAAAPALYRQLEQGGDLSQYYVESPFNQQQQQAMTNQYALGDYARQLIPSLMGQLGGQTSLGYDPSNPTARPQAFDFSSGLSGLLGNQGSLIQAQANQLPADIAARKEWMTAFQPQAAAATQTAAPTNLDYLFANRNDLQP